MPLYLAPSSTHTAHPLCYRPSLPQAAAMSATNCNQLQAAMDVVVRDKNQALDQLDKVWEGRE